MHDFPATIVVASQKGGVGKTTTVVSLAVEFARHGFRVGVLDLDPQANTTSILGNVPYRPEHTLSAVLGDDFIRPISSLFDQSQENPNIRVLPSHISTSDDWPNLHIRAAEYMGSIYDLLRKRIREDSVVADEYDILLVDPPPSLDLAMINALAMSSLMIIPLQSGDPFSQDGLIDLLKTYQRVRTHLNPDLRLLGGLITFHDPRVTVCKANFKLIHTRFKTEGIPVFDSYISSSVEVKTAHSIRRPVNVFNRSHKISVEYAALADEILNQLEIKPHGQKEPEEKS